MDSNSLFASIQQIVLACRTKTSTKALAAQQLVNLLHEINLSAQTNGFSAAEKNRHVALVLHHLQMLHSRRWINALAEWFSRTAWMDFTPPLILAGLDFSKLTLQELVISRATLIGCNFDGANLPRARFRRCQLEGCSFRQANLTNASFRTSQLLGCSFDDALTHNTRGI